LHTKKIIRLQEGMIANSPNRQTIVFVTMMYLSPQQRCALSRAALHRPMLFTESALYDFIDAPFFVAELHSRPMLDTDTALLDGIATPFLVAVFVFTPTPLLVFHYRPMLDTDSALYDTIVAPVLAAVFAFPCTPLLAMPHA
jgi:hypothetical protein